MTRREDLAALLASGAWLSAALVGGLTGWAAPGLIALLAGVGSTLAIAGHRWPRWLALAQLGAGVAAGFLAVLIPRSAGLLAVVGLLTLTSVAWQQLLGIRQYRALEQERAALARQVDRRINEIFSLQELSYVLAESLQSERIAGQVARYVTRFLNAEGCAVLLTGPGETTLRVAAAEGSLAGFSGGAIPEDAPCLATRAATSERIETGGTAEQLPLLPGQAPGRGAAAPLRAHGLILGVLAVADLRQGQFSPEDLWLLSTVSTHLAVVLANSRLFELVRQAKEEWETAFNALTEGIAVLDQQGRLARGNRALARLLDAPLPALLGRPFWPTVVGEAQGEEALLGAPGADGHPTPVTVRSTVVDRVLRLTGAPLADPAPHAAAVVLVEDVTEQRALEAQLIQSEKLAAVGQMVSGVAHELNNPLTSIAGLAEFLQERAPLAGPEREHLRVIHEQAERAGRIVRNLLTFARKGPPATEAVDLNDMVSRTALLVAYELRQHRIGLAEQRDPAPVLVRGHRDELQQVLLNLLTNAVHAVRDLPPGAPRRITLATGRTGGLALLRVGDTGAGVAPALVPQLFTPFFTTKEPGEGTGLGLSLSYRIVEAHGGRLSYQPGAEGGAEFTFTLPLAPEQEAAPMAGPRAALLVDGDAGVELVVRALFEPAGFQVEVARTAGDALAQLLERAWPVVIVDGALSADGRQLLADRLLAEPHPGRRLLVATADAALAERWQRGGVTVLPRPYLPRDLLAAAGDLLG